MKKWLGILLCFVGAGFILTLFMKDIFVSYLSKQAINNICTEEIKRNQQAEVTYRFEDVTSIGTKDMIDAFRAELPIIGEIVIPSVKLHLPIIKGVSNSVMSVGAGTLKEDQQMGKGNYALASHHMRNPKLLFSPLDKVELEDYIYLKDGSDSYVYKVIEKRIISPENVEVIADQKGKNLVTLITCNADGKKRLLVVGEFVEKRQEKRYCL